MDSLIQFIPINESTTESVPVFRNLWDFFSSKANKTVFVSIGDSTSPMVELHLSEALGCKIHLVTEIPEQWTDVKEVLKTRKILETTCDFAKNAIKKWVLPHNILMSSTPLSFSSVQPYVRSICSELSVEERIDVLKIDTSTAKLAELLYGILHVGYRPGMVLLHWTCTPDSSLETTLLAGHLQNLGYGLVAKSDTHYLYYFTDKNLYEMCSWEKTDVANPLIATLIDYSKNQVNK